MDSVAANMGNLILNNPLTPIIVTIFGSIIVSVISISLTYYFTRKRQLDMEWRKNKYTYYSRLIKSLTEVMSMPQDPAEASKRFACDYNMILLIAPQKVTEILNKFYYATEEGNIPKREDSPESGEWVASQKLLLRQLVLAIRRDLRIRPKDNLDTFQYRLRGPTFTDD